ncbi:MAG: sodium:proton antiporter [Thermomicrobiales bacterium]
MTIVFSAAVAILFGAGAYLVLKRDLIRLIAGMVLIGNAANLFIMSAALRRGSAAVIPFSGTFSDPVVQSMTLTAIVISFSITALMLALTYRVYASHDSVDIAQLSLAEEEQSELEEQDLDAEDLADIEPQESAADAEAIRGRAERAGGRSAATPHVDDAPRGGAG